VLVELGNGFAKNNDYIDWLEWTGEKTVSFNDVRTGQRVTITYDTKEQAKYAYWNLLDRSQMATVQKDAPALSIDRIQQKDLKNGE